MIREIQADQLAFPIEHFALVYVVDFGQGDVLSDTGICPEKRHLPGPDCLKMRITDAHNTVERGQQRSAIAKGIQRADLDQAFQRALADSAQIRPAGKIVQVF